MSANQPQNFAPVVCTLTTKEAAEAGLEWQELQARATVVEAIDKGARMTFDAQLGPGIENLAERERACCAFLAIDTTYGNGLVAVDVTSENPDGLAVISLISGIELT